MRNARDKIQKFANKFKWVDGILFILLLFLAGAFVIYYVSHERYFYSWDYSYYHQTTVQIAQTLRQSPWLMIEQVILSLKGEYNDYFTLPLIPVILLFGSSRLSYILGLIFIYQIPYAFTIGAIATYLVRAAKRPVFWSASFLAFLVPIFLAPTLRGYPDIFAAWMVALAVLVLVNDLRYDHWWSGVLIGFFLGAAVLLRRHFAYDAIIFLTVWVAFQGIKLFLEAYRDRDPVKRELIKALKYDALAVGSLVLVLLIFGLPVIVRMVSINYQALYTSYTAAPLAILIKFFKYYGWIVLLLALAGYTLGLLTRVVNKAESWFLVAYGMVSLFVWVVVIQISATHYTLHLTFIVILGIVALFWTAWLKSRGVVRVLALASIASLLAANWFLTLTPAANTIPQTGLTSLPYPPLYRSDYPEIVRLVEYLRENAKPDEPIYVVDTSQLVNDDLLRNAEAVLYSDRKLNIPRPPQVDSRDSYPLELLLQSKYILAADPFQSTLASQESQVAKVVHDAIFSNWKLGKDFERVPFDITLENGASLSIFRRIWPTTPEVAIDAFNQMRELIGKKPGRQADWIVLNRPEEFKFVQNDAGQYSINFKVAQKDSELPGVLLLFANPLPDRFTVASNTQSLIEKCPQATVLFQATDASGKALDSLKIDSALSSVDTSYLFDKPGMTNILTSVSLPPGQHCSGNLDWKIYQESP